MPLGHMERFLKILLMLCNKCNMIKYDKIFQYDKLLILQISYQNQQDISCLAM